MFHCKHYGVDGRIHVQRKR